MDGQAVVLSPDGTADAAALDECIRSRRTESVTYMLFDVSFLHGFDLRKVPLAKRKELLHDLIQVGSDDRLRFTEHIEGNGAVVFEHARRLGAAGIISKQADGPYARRARNWLSLRFEKGPSPQAENRNSVESSAPSPARRTRSSASVVVEPGFDLQGVRITNPDRILYPEERITKRVLAEYYEHVAEWILPHVSGRPLSLVRGPRGFERECFFQKHFEEMSLKHVHNAPVRERDGKNPYVTISDVRGLLTLAQLAVLEIHPWGSRADDIEKPDQLIFELDPGGDVSWEDLAEGAMTVGGLLDDLGLTSFVKTSGGKGLHVVVPLVRRASWVQLKEFAGAIARFLVKQEPKRYVATMSKWARPGRIFIDYLRNARGSTCVAAYSTRARAGAPVSTPLDWDELDDQPLSFSVRTVPRRLRVHRSDPWDQFLKTRQSITQRMLQTLKVN